MSSFIEFPIDFEGQQLAEQAIFSISLISIPVSYLVGLLTGNLLYLFVTFAFFLVIALLVTLPNWPFYNKHPRSWLKIKYDL